MRLVETSTTEEVNKLVYTRLDHDADNVSEDLRALVLWKRGRVADEFLMSTCVKVLQVAEIWHQIQFYSADVPKIFTYNNIICRLFLNICTSSNRWLQFVWKIQQLNDLSINVNSCFLIKFSIGRNLFI